MSWTCARGIDACPAHLARTATATGHECSALRRVLRSWLEDCIDDGDTVEDVVLAAGEALDNTVDHAFTADDPGRVTLTALCRPEALTVSVADGGRWQPRSTGPTYRGRGVDLILALTEASYSFPTGGGTVVTMVKRRRGSGPG